MNIVYEIFYFWPGDIVGVLIHPPHHHAAETVNGEETNKYEQNACQQLFHTFCTLKLEINKLVTAQHTKKNDVGYHHDKIDVAYKPGIRFCNVCLPLVFIGKFLGKQHNHCHPSRDESGIVKIGHARIGEDAGGNGHGVRQIFFPELDPGKANEHKSNSPMKEFLHT